MEESIKKWVWQHENYPNFPYQKDKLTKYLSQIEYNRGLLDGMAKLFTQKDIKEIEIDTLVEEAMNTSEIEGEYFRRESVRSSVRKKLDVTFDLGEDSSTYRSDAKWQSREPYTLLIALSIHLNG